MLRPLLAFETLAVMRDRRPSTFANQPTTTRIFHLLLHSAPRSGPRLAISASTHGRALPLLQCVHCLYMNVTAMHHGHCAFLSTKPKVICYSASASLVSLYALHFFGFQRFFRRLRNSNFVLEKKHIKK